MSECEWVRQRVAEQPIPTADDLARPFLVGLRMLHDLGAELGGALEMACDAIDTDPEIQAIGERWLDTVTRATDMVARYTRSVVGGPESATAARSIVEVMDLVTGRPDVGQGIGYEHVNFLANGGLS